MVEFRTFAQLVFAELDGAAEPGLVGLLVAHEGAKIADFEGLGEVLVVIEGLESLGFEIE